MAVNQGADGGSNPDYVVGRYAWRLYDTSGLLDVNAAGHPAGAIDAERVGEKGTLAMADLTALPGITSEGVDLLTRWRHRWDEDPEHYLRAAEGVGWRRLVDDDNVFLGRGELLRFAERNPDALTETALPFLTHFSRDLDAPSWHPNPDRSRTLRPAIRGGNDAFRADLEINRDLMDFSPERDSFLLSRRFPLGRLRWVATPGRDGPEDPERAERYFGLRWQTDHWEYVHTRPNGDLYTLQDVPADREPNFFEILRAAVLAGSLGRQYGATGFFPGPELDAWSHRLGGIDASVNLNILEMGASIIDQADPDSYPTAIRLSGSARNFWAFGKEDVPYLYRTLAVPYRSRQLGAKVYFKIGSGPTARYEPAPTEAYEVAMTLQAALWRLHQPVADYRGPTSFRIRPQHVDLFGGTMFYLQGGWPMPNKPDQIPFPPNQVREGDYSWWDGPNYRQTDPQYYPRTFDGSDSIVLEVGPDSLAFREPQTLHSHAHAEVNDYSASGSSVTVLDGDLRWEGLPRSYDSVLGFLVGFGMTARMEAENPPPGAVAPGNAINDATRLGQGFMSGDAIEFILEYQGPDGQWRPYQRAEFTYQSTFSRHYAREPFWDTAAWHISSFLVDPRTARFGGIGSVYQGWTQSSSPTGAPQTGPDSFASRLHWPEGSSMRWEDQQLASDDGHTLFSGVWSWWRQPARNSGWSFNETIDWWMNLNHAGVLENNEKAWNDRFTLAYQDPDGVMRPGVGAVAEWGSSKLGNPMGRRHQIDADGRLHHPGDLAGRPKILNRPFRSVGELAHVFRGTPWRDIDFLDPTSPDAALLDVFSLEDPPEELTRAEPGQADGPPIMGGRVNLNTASPEVLEALLAGTHLDRGRGLPDSRAAEFAQLTHDWLHGTGDGRGPIDSKAGLVSDGSARRETVGMIKSLSDQLGSADDRSINDRREFLVRTLAGGTTVRAWNFTLDLVVQSGRMTPSAGALEDFSSDAERRYWVHFALDRFTGQLLDVQWERVVE